jgi:hypothetical protein
MTAARQPPTIEDIERQIAAFGYGTPEYHEAMAHYLVTMARAQWRLADLARSRHKARP